ncbi:unnamed protein product [Pieris macdunnoughi]|uniref:Uncharacterized protein n=1 Tax=Pieris macdunnoughi TaxID=345717 RepID=A0A821VWN6_9NEOP|nr:unnamed protein product [Pieris macdunnoughi]
MDRNSKFEKCHSWYKVDIDGDFITKYQAVPIKKMRLKQKYHKPIIISEKPEKLVYPHGIITNLSSNFCYILAILLFIYCSLALFIPQRRIAIPGDFPIGDDLFNGSNDSLEWT